MADEYVKLDDVLQLLNRNSITKTITFSDGISIYESVQNLPTADVVPKSEVEVWKQNRFNLFQRLELYKMTRREAAREIFTDIEENHADFLFDGYRNIIVITEKDFAELKKKYLEEK